MAIPTPKPNPNPIFSGNKGAAGTSKVTGATTGDASAIFGNKPKPVTKPTSGKPKAAGPDPLGDALSFGKTVLGYILAPLAGVQGAVNQELKNVLPGKDQAKFTTGAFGIPIPAPTKSGVQAGAENFAASIQGKPTVTGKDIRAQFPIDQKIGNFEVLGMPLNAIDLGLDIIMDPTNLIPGKVFTTPLKAAAVGGKTALKAGKLANAGKVSAKAGVAPKIVEVAGKEVAASAELLKPGASFVSQYTKKPLIKEANIRAAGPLAERLAKTEATVGKNFLYKAVETGTKATPLQVAASAAEAGYKAAATVILGEVAQASLTRLARAEAAMAVDAAGAAVKGAAQVAEAPQIVKDGVQQDMKAYEPHIADDGVYVMDATSNVNKFGSKAEAIAWVQAQKEAPKVINTTTGIKPIVDTAPVASEALKVTAKTTSAEAAKKMLNSVERLSKGAVGVGTDLAEKKYGSFAELIAGVKAGDQVAYPVLEKILKRIDPEHLNIVEVEKAASSDAAYTKIKDVLVSKGAQTVYDTQRRMELSDAATLYKADGLGLSDVAAAYSDGRLAGTIEALPAAVTESRQAASLRVSNALDNPDTAPMMRDVLRAINDGLGKNFEYIEKEIMGSPNVTTGVSSFGDLAARSTTDAFQADTKAALLRQINQSGEAKMLGNLFGIARKRTKSTQLSVADMIARTEMMNDALLSILGGRIVYAKAVGTKESKHYVFTSLGDFMKVMQKDNEELLKAALFPDTGKAGVTKYDTLSTVGIGKAIRRVMEAKELNEVVDMKAVVDDLLSRGDLQAGWSAGFKAKSKKIANDLAIAIRDNVDEFQQIHTARAAASVEDALSSAQTLSEDLYTALMNGWKANLDTGIDSTAARAQLVRDWFNKFVYASRIFEQQNGRVAQNIFQAASMVFVRDGKLKDLTMGFEPNMPSLIGNPAARDLASKQLFADTVEAINSFFKMQNADGVAAAGRERLPFPSAASIENATAKLTQAKLAYEEHIMRSIGLATKQEIKTWETRFAKLQKGLDAARELAWKNSVPTQHYQNGKWIPSEFYNRDLAIQQAREAGKELTATAEGLVPRTIGLVDTPPAFPTMQKLTPAESAKWLAQWREKNNVSAIAAKSALREEIAKETLSNIDEYGQLNLTEGELAQRLIQDQTAKSLLDADINVYIGRTQYAGGSWFKEPAEKLSGTSGRWTLKPLLNKAETTIMTNISRVADASHFLRDSYMRKWGKLDPALRQEKFMTAFKYAMSGADVPTTIDSEVHALANDLKSILDPMFGNKETSAIIKNQIDPKALAAAFRRYGLGETIGFVSPGDLNPTQLAEYTKWLPFAEMPEDLGAIGETIWNKRADIFANSGVDPFIVLTRMIQAVQFASTEKTIVSDFASQFGYKAQGMTFEQAVANGWVKIQGDGPGTNLATHLPSPENGGLFPPDIAREFMSINREWNKLYNSKSMNNMMRTMMEVQGFLKATQTIFRPGHHIANMFGDTTTAMIAGTLNPVHWKQGVEFAMRFMTEDVRATWGKNRLTYKMENLFEGFKNYGRTVELTDKTGRTVPAITLYKDGKVVKKALDQDSLFREMQARGIIVGNIFQNDIQGLYESVAANAADLGAKQSLMKVVQAKALSASQKVEQPFGAMASWYGNIPRAAHAMRVIQSRSWKSVNEALDAAALEIGRYHPTIQSLSASERRGPRMMFTYYTWLRVAHNAFIDMALNHTAAMTVPAKLQFNTATQEGLAPSSISNPWAQGAIAPSYMTYSVYGPTGTSASGSQMLYKRSFLPLDVLDTWNFQLDPAKTWDENAVSNIFAAGRTLGKSISIVAQPAVELLTGTDMNTGTPTTVKDLPTFLDKVASNFGQRTFLEGIGLYTPKKHAEGTKNALTEEQKQNLRDNFLFGQKGQIVDTPANIKNFISEYKERVKKAND